MNEFQMQRRVTESTKNDAAQIHCVTEDGQRVTVCSVYGDKFHKI